MEDYSQYRPAEFTYEGRWIRNWFSNMIESPIEIDGIRWRSVENYYQAMKTTNMAERKEMAQVPPKMAKSMGNLILIRPNWEQLKFEVMLNGLRAKFRDIEWATKLKATNDEMIIEWNNWNDKYWGVSIKDNKGHNYLGKALMQIRDEFDIKDTSLGKMMTSKRGNNIY